MCSRFRVLLTGFLFSAYWAYAAEQRVLRVAADPNNLPFSNERLQGFENKIAKLIADELHAKLEYTWRAQRRGFFRETLKNGDCDIVLGVPRGFERSLTTNPYYKSSYAFVYRKERQFQLHSLGDPLLNSLKIGVQLVGADGANTPPVHELAAHNVISNVVGFTLYGDYRESNPPARVVEAVARGDVDVAVVWGPVAGYFVAQQKVPLELRPIADERSALPLSFEIAIGVRKGETELRDRLNQFLREQADAIESLLKDYHVPFQKCSESGPG